MTNIRHPTHRADPTLYQAVSFNFLPSQYQAGLAIEQRKDTVAETVGTKHSQVLQDTLWK